MVAKSQFAVLILTLLSGCASRAPTPAMAEVDVVAHFRALQRPGSFHAACLYVPQVEADMRNEGEGALDFEYATLISHLADEIDEQARP